MVDIDLLDLSHNMVLKRRYNMEIQKEEITTCEETKAINAFLQSYYGYKYDDLPRLAVVLLVFPLICPLDFGYSVAKLNFQKR